MPCTPLMHVIAWLLRHTQHSHSPQVLLRPSNYLLNRAWGLQNTCLYWRSIKLKIFDCLLELDKPPGVIAARWPAGPSNLNSNLSSATRPKSWLGEGLSAPKSLNKLCGFEFFSGPLKKPKKRQVLRGSQESQPSLSHPKGCNLLL